MSNYKKYNEDFIIYHEAKNQAALRKYYRFLLPLYHDGLKAQIDDWAILITNRDRRFSKEKCSTKRRESYS